MSSTSKIVLIIIVGFVAVLTVGTVGYMLIEDWNFLDSVYMTVITVGTVGFGETHELSDTGRTFTIFLILLGVGFFVYTAGNTIQFMVEGRLRRILGRMRLNNKISHMSDHYVVCGYGRIGRALCQFLIQKKHSVVVIEQDRERIEAMDADGVLYVVGDATDESNLVKAGVPRARALLTAVGTDTHNVFLVLTAKQLKPDLFVVSRSNRTETRKTLLAAGADKVISPFEIGGQRMAHAVLRPTVFHFLDMAFADQKTDIQMEEIPVHPGSDLVDTPLRESGIRDKLNLLIVARRKADGTMRFNPSAQTQIRAGDTLIVVGGEKDLDQLDAILNPKNA